MAHSEADSGAESIKLLGRGDPPPTIVTNQGGRSRFVLVGDHAGRAIPAALDGLGVEPWVMDRHIAWDIGTPGLGARLSATLDACFVSQAYSRLVIDCNRQPGAPDRAPAVSDGVVIPGNRDLSPDALEQRAEAIYQPYQDAVAAALDARGGDAVLVSLHSFTPALAGQALRPWRMGVLHRNDSVLSSAMLALLRGELGDEAGDNQPYAMDGTDNTVPLHVDPRGIDYLEIEVRQDLIADAAGQDWAAALIARLLVEAATS